jgi:hypothetical protein
VPDRISIDERFAKLGLGLDAWNKPGSVHVYESLGLRAERVYKTHEELYRR